MTASSLRGWHSGTPSYPIPAARLAPKKAMHCKLEGCSNIGCAFIPGSLGVLKLAGDCTQGIFRFKFATQDLPFYSLGPYKVLDI